MIEFLKPKCSVMHVSDAEAAIRHLPRGFDCYVFDDNVPGDIYGHQVLLDGITSGDVKVPCILMTALPDIDRLQRHFWLW